MSAAKHVFLVLFAGTIAAATSQAAAAMTRDQALAVFKNAKTDYAKVCTAGEHDAPPPLPKDIEDETGKDQTTAEGVLSRGDDAELLDALLAYIDASDCSADESRAFSLGLIFHKRPDALQAAIAALPDKSRCTLVGQLDWGWQNEIYGKAVNRKLKADRQKRLKTLQASVPKSCSGGDE